MRSFVLIMLVGSISLFSVTAIAQSGPPALCKPCLFYGGDMDGGVDEAGFYNEDILRDHQTQTFGEIAVPKGRAILIEGILFQTLFQLTSKVDPDTVTWEIRTGAIFGSGGT